MMNISHVKRGSHFKKTGKSIVTLKIPITYKYILTQALDPCL